MISVPSGRFPRAVREPPRRMLLRGLTWTRFSRWSRRSPLQSTRYYILYFNLYSMVLNRIIEKWGQDFGLVY